MAQLRWVQIIYTSWKSNCVLTPLGLVERVVQPEVFQPSAVSLDFLVNNNYKLYIILAN